MSGFSISEAQLVGLFLEAVFWGIFLVFYVSCMQTLLVDVSMRLRRVSAINWMVVVVVTMMFTIGTLDVGLGLYHNIRAFIQYTGAGGSDEEFTIIADWVNILKLANCFAQTVLGDALLIYRCWIIYSRCWKVVAFPIVLWMGVFASSSVALYYQTTIRSHATVINDKLQPVITSYLAGSISLNIITTALIVYRLWRVESGTRSIIQHNQVGNTADPPSRLRRVMFTIIESGALYTMTAILTFITYVTNNNSSYAISDALVQIIGIAFSLIIVRAASYSAVPCRRTNDTSHDMPLEFYERSSELRIVIRRDIEIDFRGTASKEDARSG